MNIWVPKVKILEPRSELLVPPSQMAGFFRMKVARPDGRIRRDTGWFPNLILNTGLDALGNNVGSMFGRPYCAVGTGNSTPVVTQTSLDNQIAQQQAPDFSGGVARGNAASPPYYGWYSNTWTFGVGAAAGILAEIGVKPGANTDNFWARALIVDELGNPTTLTILSDEILITSYQIRCYPAMVNPDGTYDDVVQDIDISGATHTVTWRAQGVTGGNWQHAYSGRVGGTGSFPAIQVRESDVLADITAIPGGTQAGNNSVSNAAYSSGSYQRDITGSFNISTGNYPTGIGNASFYLGSIDVNGRCCGAVQASFSPKILKTSTKVMSLTYRTTWARKIL